MSGDGKARLLPHHLNQLVGSGIAPDVIAERGYTSLSRVSGNSQRDRLKTLGIPRWARSDDRCFPGVLIPVYRPTGERVSWQYRPDHARMIDGKTRKYAAPAGQTSRVDVHPRNRDRIVDPTVDLWITEGIKKGDALTSHGVCVATLSGVFNWRNTHATLGDWEDVLLKGRRVVVCFDADARTNANVANAMKRLGNWLLSKGVREVAYVVVPSYVGTTEVKGADDFLAAGGTVAGLLAVAAPRPPDATATKDQWTDARLAELVAELVLEGRYHWTAALGWLEWQAGRWVQVHQKYPTEAVRQWSLDRFAAIAHEVKHGEAPAVALEGWMTMLNAGRISTVLGLAAGIEPVRAETSDFDAHPDLLNCPNGVVDLRTGVLGPHDPELKLTRMAGAEYRPGHTHLDWAAALEAIPEQVRWWAQLRHGQGATGYMTPDDVLVVQQGSGENGKSTITAGIAGALGDYYTLLADRVLLANPDDHPTELMELRGARLAAIEETPEARKLSVARLKKTVGTPKITARYIAKNSVTFSATHSLFLSSNYLPIIEETDHGTWRRLALMKYPYTFRKHPDEVKGPLDRLGDPGLRQRVDEGRDGQHEAALAWLVVGACLWYALDRVMPPPPEDVVRDTKTWRTESDLILAYIDERLVMDAGSVILSTDLIVDMNEWLRAKGHRSWSEKLLASRFAGHNEIVGNHVVKERTRLHGSVTSTGERVSRPVNPFGVPRLEAPSQQPFVWRGIAFQP